MKLGVESKPCVPGEKDTLVVFLIRRSFKLCVSIFFA